MPISLIWHNLRRRKLRTTLTVGSIVVAVFLVCLLRSLLVALNAGIEVAAANRLWVQSAVSLFVPLPLSYQPKIEAVPGVESASPFQWFGGYYKEESNFIAEFGIQPEKLLPLYPEFELKAGSIEEFAAKRNACVIGEGLANKYGWEIGSTIPLTSTIFFNTSTPAWDFEVAAIYTSQKAGVDKSMMFFQFDMLKEALDSGEALGPMGTGTYVVKLAPGADPTAVMAKIDEQYENGPQRVQATTEAEFNRQFVSMMGNIPFFLNSIGSAVAFAILLAALNTMLMSGRERARDFGILKALGFRDGTIFTLLLTESLLLALLGGGIGVALFKFSEQPMIAVLATMFPGYHVTTTAILEGLGLALAVGLLAGIGPAWIARRLRPVAALRAEA